MKKNLLQLLTFGFLLTFTSMFGQVQKNVLLEEFTNASCGPCASQNPDFNTLLDANENTTIAIKYQAPYPGTDPMNADNPDDVGTRLSYYPGVTGVPTAVMDGFIPGDDYAGGIGAWNVAGGGYAGGPYGYNQAVLDNEHGIMTPIAINVDHNLNEAHDSIEIVCVVKNMIDSAFYLAQGKLHVVLTEEEVQFASAPGSNGETVFYDVMRKMYPDADGVILDSIPAGDSIVVTYNEPLPDYIANPGAVTVVAFVQDNADKAVYQSGISVAKPLTGNVVDAALQNSTSAPAGFCNGAVTPTVVVTNKGGTTIESFDIAYSLNGGDPVSQSWTGTLATDESTTITFDEITLPGGTSQIQYTISNVNGGLPDYYELNNNINPEEFSLFPEEAIVGGFEFDFEDDEVGQVPASSVKLPYIGIGSYGYNDLSFTLTNAETFSADNPVGAYGESDKSIFIDYYQWNPNLDGWDTEGGLMFYKVDLTDFTDVKLSYDRAGARYDGSQDRLQFLISEDCGDTWEVVQDIKGAALSTVDGHTADFYVPAPGEWESDTIELNDYAGHGEVYLRMNAISSFGNNAYIDNISLGGTITGTDDKVNLLEGVETYPNPTTDVLHVDFSVETGTDVYITVFDVTGRVVSVLENGTYFKPGQYSKTWKNIPDKGVYTVKISTKNGEAVKRIIVQ